MACLPSSDRCHEISILLTQFGASAFINSNPWRSRKLVFLPPQQTDNISCIPLPDSSLPVYLLITTLICSSRPCIHTVPKNTLWFPFPVAAARFPLLQLVHRTCCPPKSLDPRATLPPSLPTHHDWFVPWKTSLTDRKAPQGVLPSPSQISARMWACVGWLLTLQANNPEYPMFQDLSAQSSKFDAVPEKLSLGFMVVYLNHAHTFQRRSLGFPTPHARQRRCAQRTSTSCKAGEQKNRKPVQSSFDTLAVHPRPQR